MLISLHDMKGYTLIARDGTIGHASDFLFDQKSWQVRYIVDKTSRMTGKEVLIPREAISKAEWRDQSLQLNLDREQIRHSPQFNLKRVLKGNQEKELADAYGWMAHWGNVTGSSSAQLTQGSSPGAGALIGTSLAGFPEYEREIMLDPEADIRTLQSSQHTIGFRIEANHGDLGLVDDFIVDEQDWTIHFMVIDTGRQSDHKKILIAPEAIDWISWRKRHVSVDLEKEKLRGCPHFNLTLPLRQEYSEIISSQYECKAFWT